jgi:hypothetical protein
MNGRCKKIAKKWQLRRNEDATKEVNDKTSGRIKNFIISGFRRFMADLECGVSMEEERTENGLLGTGTVTPFSCLNRSSRNFSSSALLLSRNRRCVF